MRIPPTLRTPRPKETSKTGGFEPDGMTIILCGSWQTEYAFALGANSFPSTLKLSLDAALVVSMTTLPSVMALTFRMFWTICSLFLPNRHRFRGGCHSILLRLLGSGSLVQVRKRSRAALSCSISSLILPSSAARVTHSLRCSSRMMRATRSNAPRTAAI